MAELSRDEIIVGIADQLPVGIWAARAPSGEFVYANEIFAEIMGTAAREDLRAGEYAEPYGIHDRTGVRYPEDQLPFVRALREQRSVVVDDLVIHRPDGKRVNIRAHARPIRDARDRITHVVIAFLDITREVEAERARDAFLSVAAHELRTPIATLQLRVHSLVQTFGARTQSAATQLVAGLETCARQVQRLVRLSEDLLDVARIQAGRFEPRLEETDLVVLIRSVMALFTEPARQVGSDLQLEGTPILRGKFDVTRIEHVVANLLSNAVKFGRGRPIRIKITQEEDRAVVAVSDQGMGVAPEHHDRIFQPFERAVSPRNYGGLGLGLWIAHESVAKMGGAIRLESAPDHGATFIVDLPC